MVSRVGFIGGAERVLISTATLLQANGYKVILACPAPGPLMEQAIRQGIEVRPIAIDRTKATASPSVLIRQIVQFFRGRKQIADLVKSLQPDVIHVHHPVGGLYCIGAAKSSDVPLLMHVHETLPLPWTYKLLARLVYRRCSHLIGVSEKSCEMIRSLGIPPDRISRIYNGVEPAFLAENIEPVQELRGSGPHIGIFGAIEPRKGQQYFIQAAARVLEKEPKAKFWVVGSTSYADNQAYHEQLVSLATSLQIRERVHFVGFKKEVPNWMAGMDVVVLASTGFESLPTVIIEAGALGRPVVATTVGGVSEILTDGETGLLIPPRNPELLAEAIDQLLGPKGAVVRERVRLDVRAKFSRSLFDRAILACYSTLAPQRAA